MVFYPVFSKLANLFESGMKHIRRILALLVLICSVVTLYADEYKHVLIITPYDRQATWSQSMLGAIESLERERTDIRFRTAVVASSSIDNVDELNERIGRICEIDEVPDLVLIFGPSNYILAEDFDRKWPGVPIMLSGELDYACSKEYVLDTKADRNAERIPISELSDKMNLTFQQAGIFIGETVELMKSMKTGLKDIYYIGGEELLSRELQVKMEDYISRFHPEIGFTPLIISDMSTEQLVSRVINIDENSGSVLYCNWHRKIGSVESVVPQRGVKKLIEDIKPVYSFFYSDLTGDYGQVGYVSYSIDEYNTRLREYILNILDKNVQPRDLPFYRIAPDKATINYNALKRFGISFDLVPEDCNMVNRPASFFEVYRNRIIYTMAGLLVAILLLILHFIVRSNRRNSIRAKQAERKSAMKSMFIQNMSHDVRTPINALVGFSQLLSLPDGSLTEEEKAEYSEYISNNANMLMMLVEDILNISDVEAGIYHINRTDSCCNDIARASMKCTDTRAAAGVRMYWTSEVEDSFTIYTDPRRVQQILVNYLTNACKHTSQGEIHIHISISENPGKVTFSVSDTGTGIPEDQKDNIFERFTMLDSKIDGTGLGLNICKTISEKLNGEVRLDSSYKGGARFLLILPLA